MLCIINVLFHQAQQTQLCCMFQKSPLLLLLLAAAAVMGTACWPFNFIHVRGDGGEVSSIRLRQAAAAQTHTDQDMSEPSAEAAACCSHAGDTNTSNTWSPQHNTTQHAAPGRPEEGESGGRLAAGGDTSAGVPPRFLCLLWYVPDTCQRRLNEEDLLQRQQEQRQLARTRAEGGGTGWDVRGGRLMDLPDQLCACMTGTH